jgi:hypothetical protein
MFMRYVKNTEASSFTEIFKRAGKQQSMSTPREQKGLSVLPHVRCFWGINFLETLRISALHGMNVLVQRKQFPESLVKF